MSPQPPDLRLEDGDRLTLSPDSRAFAHAFTQEHPKTIDEVRELIGAPEVKGAGQAFCRRQPEPAVRVVSIDELTSEDHEVRTRARELTVQAAQAYVRFIDRRGLEVWKDTINAYLEIYKVRPIVNAVTLNDIEVGNRAILVLAPAVHAVIANRVRLIGTGRIVCHGAVKFRVQSMEGNIR